MENTLSGQCLCKAVTFTVQGDPDNVFMCYCEHCQKNAGSIGQIVSPCGLLPTYT